MSRRTTGDKRRRGEVSKLREKLRRLEGSLARCVAEIDRLSKEHGIQFQRMAEMQSEIDRLRKARSS